MKPQNIVKSICISILFLMLPLTVLNANALTIKVPSDYPTIQQGINAAVIGDTVLVAPGTYVENINFNGKNITVTSESGPEVTIIDGNQADSVVKLISGEGASAVLSGFTIYNGNAGSGYGGGIKISNSSPTISNNIITTNKACAGNGVYVYFSSPHIENNTIENNVQSGCSGGVGGGGIYVGGASSAQIINNVILGNTLSSAGGGGISLNSAGTPLIKGNIIRSNIATGLSPCAKGGGISLVNSSDATIVQNLIVGNQAGCGGGVYWSVPYGNIGPHLVNNTIADNDGTTGSGIYAAGYDSQTDLINNIIVGKTGQKAVYCETYYDYSPPLFKFNNIYSSTGSAYDGICGDQTGINGNISADPLFVNTVDDNYHLLPDSPSIDVGDNSASDLPTTDLDNHDRIIDADGNGAAVVDMGAYEASNVAVAPVYYNFVNITSGNSSSPQTFTISNKSSVNLLVNGLSITGTNSSEFSISSNTCTGQPIVPSGTCTVIVVFSPVSSGNKNASLTIISNNIYTPQIDVKLSGFTDSIPPTGTISINSGVAATNSASVTLTLSCSDDVGCYQMQFSNDGATYSATESYSTSKAWTLSPGDGTKTVYVKFTDAGGNLSAAYSHTIKLDTTAPTTSASPAGGTYTTPQGVTLTCNDVVGAGCDKIYYTTDGATPTTSSTVYSTQLSISSTTTLKFFAADLAGNNEAVKTETYTITILTGSISGTVTDGTNGIQSVSVYIYDANGSYIASTATNSNGNYTFSGLATGNYKIRFNSSGVYAGEWYNDKTAMADSDTISLSSPSDIIGVNAVLAKGGSISGRITDGSVGLKDIYVSIPMKEGNLYYDYYAYTDADGNYTLSGLPTGSYKVAFFSRAGYLGEWYNDKATEKDADLISVTAPNLTTGVNAVLAKGGSIAGTVTDGTNSIPNVYVYISDQSDVSGKWIYVGLTDSSGNYTINSIPTGSYKVYFDGRSSGYVGEYYNDKSWSSGDVISVSAPNAITGINAVLALGGSISGKVTDGVSGLQAWVCVSDAEGIYISGAATDASGNYTVKGVPAGNFKVLFEKIGYYAAEWYNNNGDFYSAEPVAVTVLNDTPNIDAVLTTGQSILAFPILPVFDSTTVGTAAPSQKLTVYNYGSTTLTISSISLSGANASDFSIINDPCSGTILTTSSYYCEIEVAFNPTSTGTRNSTISIQSDDPDTPVLNVPLSGTATTPDTSPTAFTFTDRTNVSLNSVIASNSITVSDINSSAPISITGGEYMINSGSWTASDGTVNSGDVVTVRQTTSSTFSTTTDTVLTIGGMSDTFSVTTTSPGTLDDTGPSYKRVDGYDLIKLSIAFGSTPGDPNWSEACNLDNTGASYDAIDGNDLIVFGTHFGEVEQ